MTNISCFQNNRFLKQKGYNKNAAIVKDTRTQQNNQQSLTNEI